jgi:hypothetical protein
MYDKTTPHLRGECGTMGGGGLNDGIRKSCNIVRRDATGGEWVYRRGERRL